ncbi:head decoration protein [Sphingomonas sp. Leaf4]|uniref:head decoration protein n=1 Tax=Sphingomonas sp. Leaf4 TaxID=2876553 RepID=UPI001E447F24|nr:head decoration protein [Sphingomonas sp. Leaf4]
MYANAQFSSETSSPAKTLIRSGSPITRKVTLVAGVLYAAGSVLGTVTADGKAKLSAAASSDGSQTPDVVLPYAVDTRDGEKQAVVYERADLIGDQLVLGAGHTLTSIREGLRLKSITFSI